MCLFSLTTITIDFPLPSRVKNTVRVQKRSHREINKKIKKLKKSRTIKNNTPVPESQPFFFYRRVCVL